MKKKLIILAVIAGFTASVITIRAYDPERWVPASECKQCKVGRKRPVKQVRYRSEVRPAVQKKEEVRRGPVRQVTKDVVTGSTEVVKTTVQAPGRILFGNGDKK